MTHADAGSGTGMQRYCGARKTRSEGTCTRPAGWGTSHPGAGRCKFHTGSTPGGVKAARKEQARAVLARYGVEVEAGVDPIEVLSRLLGEASANTRALREMVQELPSLIEAATGRVHPLVELYGEERDRAARIAKDAAALGLEERRVSLSERQGEALAAVVMAVLGRLGLTRDLVERGRAIAAEEIRVLAAGVPTAT